MLMFCKIFFMITISSLCFEYVIYDIFKTFLIMIDINHIQYSFKRGTINTIPMIFGYSLLCSLFIRYYYHYQKQHNDNLIYLNNRINKHEKLIKHVLQTQNKINYDSDST